MQTVEQLIAQLEKVKDKKQEVTVRVNAHIVNIIDIFEAEANGTPFICIDCEGYRIQQPKK